MAKQPDLPSLSDAQLEIMNAVWDRGDASVADVWAAVSANRAVDRNTVQTMLVRLEEKGWLAHRTAGRAFRYYATRPRQPAQKELVRRVIDTAFAGSADGLIMALLEERGISKAEAERIRQMIERAERRTK
jgi:BlaI family penicillinase repressor